MMILHAVHFPLEEHRVTNYVNNIDKALLGWKSGSCDGSWSKGALTTALCKFVEHYCKTWNLESSPQEQLRLLAPWCHLGVLFSVR